MNTSYLLTLWSDDPGTSMVIWAIFLIAAMYLGRASAHRLISAATSLLQSAMRSTAESLSALEQRVVQRNKQVILHTGQEATERTIEREFHRVNTIVERDLSGYPAVQRKIADTINQIETDYQDSRESPPSPPEWLEAVEAISKIQRNGDSTVDQILGNIQETLEKAHNDTIKVYHKNNLDRLQILKKMLPHWRSLSNNVSESSKGITDLSERAESIDKQMQVYEQIRSEDDKITRILTSSSLTQFFVAGLVLIIAALGGVINFQLIALPMSEMVGGTSQIGGWRTADIAAMVIIMVEVAMGLFLLESLRITHLFPVITSMDDKMRKRMIIITLAILTILASVEASLAYMRDLLAMDREALAQSLSGVAASNVEFRWIPSIGQMIMGFILPFALAFVAIPLESFVSSSRTVIGLVSASTVRMMAYVVNTFGQIMDQVGRILVHAYDMVIFLPLAVEQSFRNFNDNRSTERENKAISGNEPNIGGIKS